MPESHEIADLVHEFNRGENTIQCNGSSPLYARLCSYFAMAGLPFVTVPQDTERIIIVLADEKSWKPVFELACHTDDDALVRMVLDELRGKAMASVAPMMAAMYPPMAVGGGTCDEVTYSDSDVLKVMLTGVPDLTRKIEVIKVVRMITHKGLKEAKDLVDLSIGMYGTLKPKPQLITGAPKKEAEDIGRSLIMAGATVSLEPEAPF